jgi:hypothetical protein
LQLCSNLEKMNQPDLAPSMETPNHRLTLLRRAINRHNQALGASKLKIEVDCS